MPVTHSFDGAILTLRASGLYNTADLRGALDSALAAREGGMYGGLLFDLSESQSLDRRTATDIQDMARFLAGRAGRFGNRIGMVATSDLAYGLMRMGGVIAESGGLESAVFRSVSEAREWLSRPRGDDPTPRGPFPSASRS